MTDALNTPKGEVVPYEAHLVLIADARGQLAQARSIGDVLDVLALAEAAKAYGRAKSLGMDARNYAAEIVARAQRRLGQLLAEEGPNVGNPQWSQAATNASLADLGVSKDQSSRAQRLAAVPEELFEAHIATVLADEAKDTELTLAGLRRLAARVERETVVTPPMPTGKHRCIVIDPPWPLPPAFVTARQQCERRAVAS